MSCKIQSSKTPKESPSPIPIVSEVHQLRPLPRHRLQVAHHRIPRLPWQRPQDQNSGAQRRPAARESTDKKRGHEKLKGEKAQRIEKKKHSKAPERRAPNPSAKRIPDRRPPFPKASSQPRRAVPSHRSISTLQHSPQRPLAPPPPAPPFHSLRYASSFVPHSGLRCVRSTSRAPRCLLLGN